MNTIYTKIPLGYIEIISSEIGIHSISIKKESPDSRAIQNINTQNCNHAEKAIEQIHSYFLGHLTNFTLKLTGDGTSFQNKVWKSLATIPYGETRTYGQIAAAIGIPGGARAVGLANNRNPFAIVIPCHRVIGASGKLTGYRGGLDIKKWLLDHEQNNCR